jgi:uncharacterized protein
VLRVAPDTNIYVSALNFGGVPERFLRVAEAGIIQVVTSDAILAELAQVLRGEKFGWPEEEISKALRQLARFTEHVEPIRMLSVIQEDPADNRILECAEAGKADYIISGDRHLLRLKHHGEIPIIKVADFMRRLRSGNG